MRSELTVFPIVNGRARRAGFTLIELLVVLAIISLLLSIAMPRFYQTTDMAKERVLVENLRLTRSAIDKFYEDNKRYPTTIDELVQRRYLRAAPIDPMTRSSNSWLVIPPPGSLGEGVYDISSGTPGAMRDGRPYASL